jgi:hypothetical protein
VLQRKQAIQVEEAQMQAIGTARLTEGIPAQRAVAAYVPRQEITTVLQDPDAEPELVLRVRGNDDGPDTLTIDWSRSELEELLERISDDTVVLTFDQDELAYAFSDVEAHGLREKALVFTVAAMGALGAGAGIANAMPVYDGGDSAVPVSVSAPDITTMTDASSGGGYVETKGSAPETFAVLPGEHGTAGGFVASEGSAAGSPETFAVLPGEHGTPGGFVASEGSAAGSPETFAVLPGEHGTPGGFVAAEGSAADSIRTDVSSTGGYAATSTEGSSGQFLGIHEPSTTDAFLVGGILLTLAGATFASRRIERPHPA